MGGVAVLRFKRPVGPCTLRRGVQTAPSQLSVSFPVLFYHFDRGLPLGLVASIRTAEVFRKAHLPAKRRRWLGYVRYRLERSDVIAYGSREEEKPV